ncbi:MAG: redoxin domain-containing protein [Bacteroidales bacterium]|nr:redoxin domain-containing protein [Bacteroidales bacterium]
MKRIPVFILTVYFLQTFISCRPHSPKDGSGIEFVTNNTQAVFLVMTEIVPEGSFSCDTILISPDKNTFYGHDDSCSALFTLNIDETQQWIILNPGDRLKYTLDSKIIIGSLESEKFNHAFNKVQLNNEKAIQLIEQYVNYDAHIHSENYRDSILHHVQQLKENIHATSLEFIHAYPSSPATQILLFGRFGKSRVFTPQTDWAVFQMIDSIIRQQNCKSRHHQYFQNYYLSATADIKHIQQLEKQISDHEKVSEIQLPGPAGQMISSNSLKGKNVLLFFWSAADPFCLSSLKQLRKHYPLIKKNNTEILAVSFDYNQDLWNTVVTHAKTSWVNVNEQGFPESPIARTFCISSDLPVFIGMDQKGNFTQRYSDVFAFLNTLK